VTRALSTTTLLAFLLLLPASSGARTWIVDPDGTGEAPTIAAAVDSAAYQGDVIELMDGVYTGDGNRDIEVWGKLVIIRSQSDDPTACIIDIQATPDDMHFGFQLYGDG
jgi:hypothetical protein